MRKTLAKTDPVLRPQSTNPVVPTHWPVFGLDWSQLPSFREKAAEQRLPRFASTVAANMADNVWIIP
jgi:hypothetical protein